MTIIRVLEGGTKRDVLAALSAIRPGVMDWSVDKERIRARGLDCGDGSRHHSRPRSNLIPLSKGGVKYRSLEFSVRMFH